MANTTSLMTHIMNLKSTLGSNISSLNSSKYFAGLIMLTMNIASRYATLNFSDTQEEFVKDHLARELLIFSIAWMGSKDIFIAIVLTACFIFLADYALNDESAFCISPAAFKKIRSSMDLNGDGEISADEIEKATILLEKASTQAKTKRNAEFMGGMSGVGGVGIGMSGR
jgi:hypothetical protein